MDVLLEALISFLRIVPGVQDQIFTLAHVQRNFAQEIIGLVPVFIGMDVVVPAVTE